MLQNSPSVRPPSPFLSSHYLLLYFLQLLCIWLRSTLLFYYLFFYLFHVTSSSGLLKCYVYSSSGMLKYPVYPTSGLLSLSAVFRMFHSTLPTSLDCSILQYTGFCPLLSSLVQNSVYSVYSLLVYSYATSQYFVHSSFNQLNVQ